MGSMNMKMKMIFNIILIFVSFCPTAVVADIADDDSYATHSLSLMKELYVRTENPKYIQQFVYYSFMYWLDVRYNKLQPSNLIEEHITEYLFSDCNNWEELIKNPLGYRPDNVVPLSGGQINYLKKGYDNLCLEFYEFINSKTIKRKQTLEYDIFVNGKYVRKRIPSYKFEKLPKAVVFIEPSPKGANADAFSVYEKLYLQLINNYIDLFDSKKYEIVNVSHGIGQFFYYWVSARKKEKTVSENIIFEKMRFFFQKVSEWNDQYEYMGLKPLHNPLLVKKRVGGIKLQGYQRIRISEYFILVKEFRAFMLSGSNKVSEKKS